MDYVIILIQDYSKLEFVLYWAMEVKYGDSDILIKKIQSKIKLFGYTSGFTGLFRLWHITFPYRNKQMARNTIR